MAVIALISNAKNKQDYSCEARELYAKSNLFRLSYDFAQLVADKTFILSAKHALVSARDRLDPYDEDLKSKSPAELDRWAEKVIKKLRRFSNPERDNYIILAGKDYYEPLLPFLQSHWLPLERVGLFERPARLKELIEAESSTNGADLLHLLFNSCPRYHWNDIEDIPFKDGIYVLFERNEIFKGLDRIVLVGSNPYGMSLTQRLKDHFIRESKEASIVRKNIGRSFLNADSSPYLKIWNKNMTHMTTREEFGHLIDIKLEERVERVVSDYLRSSFSFALIPVESNEEKLRIEEGIIATLISDKSFKAGEKWFGFYSPIAEIAENGLWNVEGLYGEPLNAGELEKVKYLTRFGKTS